MAWWNGEEKESKKDPEHLSVCSWQVVRTDSQGELQPTRPWDTVYYYLYKLDPQKRNKIERNKQNRLMWL